MRKKTFLPAFAAVALALAGCANDKPAEGPAQSDTTTTAPQQEAQVQMLVFYARWCPICNSMKDDLAALQREQGAGSLRIVDADTPEGIALMETYRINGEPIPGVPALITLRNGDVVGGALGKKTLAQMTEMLDSAHSVQRLDSTAIPRSIDITAEITMAPTAQKPAAPAP